jgi:hypothetical protein
MRWFSRSITHSSHFGVDGRPVRHVELPWGRSLAAPRLDETPGLVELQHARIALRAWRVTLDDEDVAVCGDGHVVGLIQQARASGFIPLTRLSSRSQRQQHLALGIQLQHDVRADIRRPEVALGVDPQPMRAREHLVAERAHERAVPVEFEERLRPSREDIEVPLPVERHRSCRPHRRAGRQGHRVRYGHVVERRRLFRDEQRGIRRTLRERGRPEPDDEDGEGDSLHRDLRSG